MPLLESFDEFDNHVAFASRLELAIFVYKKNISKAQLRDLIMALNSADSADVEIWIGSAFSELRRRKRIVGNGFPAIVDGPILKAEITNASEFYKFLMLLSESEYFRDKISSRIGEVDCLFDEVVRRSVSNYLGVGTESVRFGWPPSEDRPGKFTDAVCWLCEKLYLPLGPATARAVTKDGGVDLVFWKPFLDKRGAFLLAFFQCTIQSDWMPKRKDILASEWLGYIASGRTAVTGLAIPFVITGRQADWDTIRHSVRIFMDRIRIASFLSEADLNDFPGLIEWNRVELTKFV